MYRASGDRAPDTTWPRCCSCSRCTIIVIAAHNGPWLAHFSLSPIKCSFSEVSNQLLHLVFFPASRNPITSFPFLPTQHSRSFIRALLHFNIFRFKSFCPTRKTRFIVLFLFIYFCENLLIFFVATSSAKWNCGFFFKIAVRLRWNVSGRRKESSSWFVGNKNDDNLYVLHGRASRIELWRERVPAEKELSVCMRSTGIKSTVARMSINECSRDEAITELVRIMLFLWRARKQKCARSSAPRITHGFVFSVNNNVQYR